MTRARRAIVAIGRSGNHRRLGVPGEEDPDRVFNRLYDPKEFVGRQVLVVGGGDSALETAIALGSAGAHVTLSYRKKEFQKPRSWCPREEASIWSRTGRRPASRSARPAQD